MHLEQKHYIFLAIAFFVVFYLLHKQRTERFDIIDTWPFMPPRHWKSDNRRQWSPWWYHQYSDYHQAIPEVTNYDNVTYRIPPSSRHMLHK